jgi:hypothetical protein
MAPDHQLFQRACGGAGQIVLHGGDLPQQALPKMQVLPRNHGDPGHFGLGAQIAVGLPDARMGVEQLPQAWQNRFIAALGFSDDSLKLAQDLRCRGLVLLFLCHDVSSSRVRS